MCAPAENPETAERDGAGGPLATRPWLSLALLGLAALFFVWEFREVRPQFDDAYISYRYARNLVEGNGLVYNVGEYVEGITNLFWTLCVAFGLWLGLPAQTVGHALGLASGVATLAGATLLASTGLKPRERWAAGGVPWLVLSSSCFSYWVVSGMETPLYCALILAALLAAHQDRLGWATLAAFLATGTRPDAGLVAVAIYGVYVFQSWPKQRWSCLRWPVVFGVLLIALTAFRLYYYGSPVPNTFYAKVGGQPFMRGVWYTVGFVAGGTWPLLFPAAIALRRDRRLWTLGLYGLLLLTYVICVAGDAFAYSRFYFPLVSILAVLAVRGAVLGWRRDRGVGGLAWACVLGVGVVNFFGRHSWDFAVGLLGLGLIWAAAVFSERRRLSLPAAVLTLLAAVMMVRESTPTQQEFQWYYGGVPGLRTRSDAIAAARIYNRSAESLARRRARIIRERMGPEAVVATGGIGSFGYYSRATIIDIFGLIDPQVASSMSHRHLVGSPGHLRSNPDYVFERRPDFILIPKPGQFMVNAPAMLDLWDHPALDAHYEWDDELPGYRRKPDA